MDTAGIDPPLMLGTKRKRAAEVVAGNRLMGICISGRTECFGSKSCHNVYFVCIDGSRDGRAASVVLRMESYRFSHAGI